MPTIHASAALAAGFVMALLLIKIAPAVQLVDHPGGRKEHATVTPLVGGIGIALVLLGYLAIATPPFALAMAGAVIILMVVGVTDDVVEVKPLPKFAVQAFACAVMAQGASVTLRSVGDLFGMVPVGMWVFALPMTLFAIIGVINAINMFDGIDGHAGGAALVAFIAYAWVARESGLLAQHHTLLVLAGATLGFLLLNARFPWNARARTFLGDAGSMLLGFLIGWFAIDLTAGNGAPSAVTKTFPPICALWVIVIPLCDCVSLMLRRKLAGRSMFVADRQHLHHYLLNRGLSVGQASAFSFVLNAICASVGVLGWKFGVPESALFAGFVSLFVVYHWHMLRAFRVMPTHSNMGPSST
jgi:UDP-GlcNAc:undecaprenyl-phosphate GlcNAc-1-phosphate transferase